MPRAQHGASCRRSGFVAEDGQRHVSAALIGYGDLYRAWWLRTGGHVLDAARSPMLADAVTRGTGRLETYVLPYRYLHLLPLVGTA